MKILGKSEQLTGEKTMNNYCSTCLGYIASDPCDGCDGTEENHIYYEPDFVKKNTKPTVLVKPTEKQIAFATYLAQRMCVELPKENTKESYSAFIDKWKPLVAQEDKAMNESSEWQLRYC